MVSTTWAQQWLDEHQELIHFRDLEIGRIVNFADKSYIQWHDNMGSWVAHLPPAA